MSFDGDLYPTSGATSVLSTKGDLVRYNTERERYGIGSAGQVLQVSSSLPTWSTINLADSVLTTQGDVLYEGASALARLGQSTDNFTLATKGAGANPAWQASSTSVLTTTGDLLYASGANTLARLAGGTATHVLTANGAGVAPSYQAPAGGGALQLVRSRLPQEDTETVVVDQLYKMGFKDWKVTQIEKPIKFVADDDSNLSAISDDMTGYSSDAEFDAVWVTSDGTNLNPSASDNRINGTIANGSDAACYYDLGHTIENDSVFTLIFSLQWTTNGSGNKKIAMGLSDSTADFTTNQNFTGIAIGNDNSIVTGGSCVAAALDQVSAPEASFSQLADSTNRYYVINGLGFGRFSCTMYNDLQLGKNYETETQTYNGYSAATGMRYIKIALWSKTSGTSTVFNISNVMFLESDHPMLIFNK